MEEKKHIDRLYQEKFKDFEVTPREIVWKSISSRLKERERKRAVLPIWYRIAGVAAILALFINFANGLFKTSNNTHSPITSMEQDENFGEFDLTSPTYNQDMIRSSIVLQALILDTKSKEIKETLKAETFTPTSRNSTPFTGIIRNTVKGIKTSAFNIDNNSSLAIEISETEQNSPVTGRRNLPLPTDDNSNDITDEAEVNPGSKRIQITTTAAPIYFNNISSGRAIDAQFANNESGSAVSLSYGLNFAYQLSNKIKIRSGINKVNLSYNTRNIAFTAAVNPVALSGVNYSGEIPKYRIENSSGRPFSNIQASTEFNRASIASPASGYLNQKLGFVEVPLEVEYVIIDKKIGLNIIGGGSTLFLDENMISLNSANFSTQLGEANNLNSVSFSTNIGVGVDYNISPQLQLNLEPIFKYQINTFNTTSTGNPYYFGIYSGFSFKF